MSSDIARKHSHCSKIALRYFRPSPHHRAGNSDTSYPYAENDRRQARLPLHPEQEPGVRQE